jgi:hypothetical protein
MPSVKIDDESQDHLARVKAATRLPKSQAMNKAVKYWAPRVLTGEISLVDGAEDDRTAALPLRPTGTEGRQ